MHWNDYVKGAKDSIIARTERNDCTVLALAAVTESHYETAYYYAKGVWNRHTNTGIPLAKRINSTINFNSKILGKTVSRVGDKPFNSAFSQLSTLYYEVGPYKKQRNMTTLKFRQLYPKGRYLVVSRGHAFAIIDGLVVGNFADLKQDKRVLLHAWKFE